MSFGLFSKLSNASAISEIKEEVREVFAKEYNEEDLVNILANIENDIKNNDIEAVKKRSSEVKGYIKFREAKVAKHRKKYSASNSAYGGNKVLELEYQDANKSQEALLVLPLAIVSSPLAIDISKNKEILSSFRDNEINGARVKYVSYDIGNKKTGVDLKRLLSSVKKGDVVRIRENTKDIYADIFIDHYNKISLVSKIRDNLAVAKYLVGNNQPKAAQNTVSAVDSFVLKLAELNSNSLAEKEKIEELRKELKNVSRVADDSYLSKWEKFPEEIGNWWKK